MCSPSWPREGLILPHRRDASEITWSSESRCAWPFYPDRIADQLGIGVHQLVAFLHLSAYQFQTVFPSLFVCHPTASYRHPLRVSAGCRESSWMVQTIAGCRRAKALVLRVGRLRISGTMAAVSARSAPGSLRYRTWVCSRRPSSRSTAAVPGDRQPRREPPRTGFCEFVFRNW